MKVLKYPFFTGERFREKNYFIYLDNKLFTVSVHPKLFYKQKTVKETI